VTFAAGNVHAVTSSVSVVPGILEADGISHGTVTVTPRDAFSNTLSPGQAVVVGTNLGSVGAAVDRGDGTYTATYTAGTVTGVASVTATVNGVLLNASPSVTLIVDTTPPAAADLERITFGTPSGGISQIVGGAGSVEPLSSVRLENTNTLALTTVSATSQGSFVANLGVTSNQTVCIRVDDLAGNMSAQACEVPFVVTVTSVVGVLRAAQAGGGFAPVSGELVELDIADLTDPLAPGFTPLFIDNDYLTDVTGVDGSFEIVLPSGFVPDPDLAVVTGPDGDLDGSVDLVEHHALVNDIARTVVVDEVSDSIIFLIGFNDILLNEIDPCAPAETGPCPEFYFTPLERTSIETTIRAATTALDFTTGDPVQLIGDDVFFDVDGPKDAPDQTAYDTFEAAAKSAGTTDPPVLITGTVRIPGVSGELPLAGVTVKLSTLSLNPLTVSPLPGASGVTDSSGNYSLTMPGFVSPGSTTVAIVIGDLTYNGSGVPGAFNGSINTFSIGTFITDPSQPMKVDLGGRISMSLLPLASVPLANFNPLELEQLEALVRSKLAASPPAVANLTLVQVFQAAFTSVSGDNEVTDLLAEISDPESGADNSNVTASPTILEGNGVSTSTITVEPLDGSSQRVGPGLLVTLTSTLGTITTPAIDNLDGTYTAYLTAPTTVGTATVTAFVEGAELTEKPTVDFTPDGTAPSAPSAARLLVTSIGGGTVTVIGLPGAVEPRCSLEVQNTTTLDATVVIASEVGGFRADVEGIAGHSLSLRCSDAAGNMGGATVVVVGTAIALPAITNPSALPGGVTVSLATLPAGSLGASVPSGFTFLSGFRLDLEGESASAPLDVVTASEVPVPPGSQVLLVQVIEVEETLRYRVVAPGRSAGGILSPVGGADVSGVLDGGDYAYLSTPTPTAFAVGQVTGTRGPIDSVLMTMDVSPFVDLTRANGRYLLAGPVGPAAVGSKLFVHAAATETTALLPYVRSQTRFDFSLATRADTAVGFVGRFRSVGQLTQKLAVTPAGNQLYVMRNATGDISIVDTGTLQQVAVAEDVQNISDLAFAPNGFEAFIAYFARVRDFTISIQEPGLLLSGVGFPLDVAISPNSDLALVTSSLDNNTGDTNPDAVYVIDTFTNAVEASSIPVGSDPRSLVVNRAGTRAYVVNETTDTLTVIDIAGRSVLATVPLGNSPSDVVVSPDGSEIYVADRADDTVRILSAALAEDGTPGNELLATVGVGNAPSAVVLSPSGATLLVAEEQDDTISLISVATRTVTEVWAATDLPLDVAVHPDGRTAWVLDPVTRKGVLEVALAESDTTSPLVLDVGPKDRAGTLLQDSPVEATFSEAIDPATFTPANVQVLDAGDLPIAGTLASSGNGVSVSFTPAPGVRYALNSTVKMVLGTGLTDPSGLPLTAPVERVVPSVTMQLPNLLLISADLTPSGVEVAGSAGAVEPSSQVEVTNLTSAAVFRTNAAPDGSFAMIVVGLDDDGYELITKKFGGRATTNPVPVPVNFNIVLPDPSKITYQAGPAGTLMASGAAGAVDPQSSKVTIRNLTSGQSFVTTTINPDGSFALGIFASTGNSLDLVSEILGAITLAPVPLTIPILPAPSLEFLTPDRFVFGTPTTLTVVGTNFGAVPGNILLTLDGVVRGDFVLDDVLNFPGRKAIVVALASGADSGTVRVTVAGQPSNVLSYFSQIASNTSPFAEEVIAASLPATASEALGASDGQAANLGQGGSITLRLGSTVLDGPGNDFQVFEDTSDGADCYDVRVSAAQGGPFDFLGTFCGTSFVNLSGHGPIRFVRILDANDGGNAARIDAVFAIRVQLTVTVQIANSQGQFLAARSPKTAIEEEPATVADLEKALARLDGRSIAVGAGGALRLDLGAAIDDGDGPEIRIVEDLIDGGSCYEVRVSATIEGREEPLGRFCGSSSVDLAGRRGIRFVTLAAVEEDPRPARIDTVAGIGIALAPRIVAADERFGSRSVTGISVTVTPPDTAICTDGTVNLSASVSPPPQGGGGYGGGCSDNITWSVSGGGSVSPTSGATTTFTAGSTPGRSTVTVNVSRTGNCQDAGSDSKSVTIDVEEIDIVGHQPGTRSGSGAAVSDADEDDPKNLYVQVNDDQDDGGPNPDNDDMAIGTNDDDIVKVTLEQIDLDEGTVTVSVSSATAVRVFNSSGSAELADYTVDLASPSGDLAGIAGGDVDLYLEGLEKNGDVTVKLEYSNGSDSCSDEVHLAVVRVGLDVDSNNDGAIDDVDDPIEDDSNLPGAVVLTDLLDFDGNGVPGFADGIDLHGNAGSNRSNKFERMILTIPEDVDSSVATLAFTYQASPPSGVTRNPASGNAPLPIYSPASAGFVRVFTKDGIESRQIASVSDGSPGDYVPPGTHVAEKILQGGARSVTLFVEGVNESASGEVRIEVALDPDGSTGSATPISDAVRLTSAWLEVDFRDVTGLKGIGNTAATAVPRIPAGTQPDGIACDWQTDVSDGALLVMRVIGSQVLEDLINEGASGMSVDFGFTAENSTSFASLPGSGREGEFKELTDTSFVPNATAALGAIGIEPLGGSVGSHKVLAARFFKPPVEFDLSAPLNTKKERKVSLAVNVTGKVEEQGSKPHAIALVRPPLVLVHGVNSGPGVWTTNPDGATFVDQFDTGPNHWGFIANDFRVDHSVADPLRGGEGATLGFGEISNMYTFVRDKIAGSPTSAKDKFRSGAYFDPIQGSGVAGKRVAIQKVDIVAHSYGGLLSRWYIERAGSPTGQEFDDRKDVRKLTTLGTPHRGSPLANIVCEVLRGGLIADANAEGIGSVLEPTLAALLSGIDVASHGLPLSVLGFSVTAAQGNLPNALTPARTAARHAYQVFSVGSQRLADLNGTPFDDDVGYAAIIGTQSNLFQVNLPGAGSLWEFDAFFAMQANRDPGAMDASKPYFPWLKTFNAAAGATDGVVPAWSAALGVPSHNVSVAVNHISMQKNAALNNQVRTWLNNPIPRGAAQRAGFTGIPKSELNGYVGSTHAGGAGSPSVNAGVNPDAIIKVELSPTNPHEATFGTDSTQVGPRPITLTGMIRVNQIGTATFTIVADEVFDETLHNLGALPQASLGIAPGQLAGAAGSDYVAHRITSGRVGRRQEQELTGPDGGTSEALEHFIGYESPAVPGTAQSPPTKVTLPVYVLAPLTKGGPGNLTVSFTGAAETRNAGTGTQTNTVNIIDDDGAFNPNETLQIVNQVIPHPANVWNGVLIPYSGSVVLFLNGSGYVAGANDSSDEAPPAELFQELIEPGLVSNPSSATILVP